MYTQSHRLHLKLEENARSATVMLQHARVMRDTILVSVQWRRARGDVGRGDYVEEVLVCYECCVGMVRG